MKFLAGIELPNMTTAQRDSLPNDRREKGTTIFNTTTNQIEVNIGTGAAPAWLGMQTSDYGAALPTTNLFNGRRYSYFHSQGSWGLIYRADLDAVHPWHYDGGTPALVGPWSQTSTVGANAVWEDTGDRYTFPRAGVYLVELFGKNVSNPGATFAYASVGVNTQQVTIQGTNSEQASQVAFAELTVAANDVLDSYHRDDDITRRMTFGDLRIRVTPRKIV